MAKPYSADLRERVVRAVAHDGLSRRAAAQRFGIGVSTVITWMQRWRDTGDVEPGQMGGHRPKKIAGTWRTWLLQRCRDRAFTLRGRVGELAERGLKVDYRVVWAFVHAENLTHKKDPTCQRAGPRGCRAATRAMAETSR
jgi:putative transposase